MVEQNWKKSITSTDVDTARATYPFCRVGCKGNKFVIVLGFLSAKTKLFDEECESKLNLVFENPSLVKVYLYLGYTPRDTPNLQSGSWKQQSQVLRAGKKTKTESKHAVVLRNFWPQLGSGASGL